MTTASKYASIAEDVLKGVGGKENVRSLTHCATRLRFVLVDPAKADKAAVESTRGVITVVEAGGQFQVVIGNTVDRVYAEALAQGVEGAAPARPVACSPGRSTSSPASSPRSCGSWRASASSRRSSRSP